VAVDQTLVSLAPSQQAQFSATVVGRQGVTWSISPLLGSINS